MKKNLFMSMLAMAGMLFATSCSQDELLNEPTTGDYVNAKFTIGTTDGIATRATIGNGTKADKVACAVYDEEGTELTTLYKVVDVVDKKATYEIRLAKGQKYRVAFFAYNSTADAYDVTNLKNITVKDSQNSNIENRDAFTAYFDVDATVNAINEDVTLYRPFAQLNLGVDKTEWTDAVNAGVTVSKSKIVVTNVYNQFSAYDNAVVATAEPVTMTFEMNTIPTEELEVDVDRDGKIADTEKFKYLALNYLLVGDAGSEKSLTDVEFVWENSDASKTNNPTTHFKNIPVQRNYRTNIIGKLLTNPATFNIIIDERFEKPDYIVDAPWDGTSVEEPAKDADGAYVVKTAAELVWLANRPTTDANGDPYLNDIKLASDIDLNGNDINAITFKGTFDGQNHTISNLVLVSYDGTSTGAGLFGERTMGTIKNLKIKNATADVTANEDGYAGAVLAAITDQGDVTLENVHVYNSDIKGVMSVGGLVGSQHAANVKLTLNNCSVNDTKVGNNLVTDKTENGHVAGLVGRVNGTLTINENVSLNNVDVTGYYSEKRKEASIDAVAATNVKDNLGTITGTATTNNVTVSKIPTTASAGNATIASASGMFAFANSVNAGGNNYSGKTVTLAADIDLDNQDWEPIGQTGETQFNGTFDGGTYTISNLAINSKDQSDESHYASGLFGWTEVGTLKNITIKGAKVEGGHLCAAVIGYVSGSVKVESCKVSNAEINCAEQSTDDTDPEGDKAACIVGQVGGGPDVEGYITVSNCSAENSVVKAGRDAGQIVGTATSGNAKYVDVNSCSATNVTVEWNNTSTGKNINNTIIGRS